MDKVQLSEAEINQIPSGFDFVEMVLGDQITEQRLDQWTDEQMQQIHNGDKPTELLCYGGFVIRSGTNSWDGNFGIVIMLEKDWSPDDRAIYGYCR